MKVNVPLNRKPRIEMLPLIDIVFLLLVVFIYAMLSMAVHRGLPVVLPTSETAGVDKRFILSVTVKADGSIYVNEDPVRLNHLAETLENMSKEKRESGILLFADRSLSYQRLFRVLDQIRTAGVRCISLQAEMDPLP